jgi:chromosome segregation ATPase
VTDTASAIEFEQFERVIAAPGTALLRVLARRAPRHDSEQRPTLLAADGETVRRFAPLPAPSDPSGMLRAAYPVPIMLLGPHSTYALELPDGAVMDLPAPTHGSRRVAASARRDDDREEADRQEREAQHTARKLADALAAGAEADHRAVAAARAAAAAARAAAAAEMRAETLELRLADLEAGVLQQVERGDALERDLADAAQAHSLLEHKLSTANAARARSEQDLERTGDELKVMSAERDELIRQVDAHDSVAVKARERAKQAEEAHADVAAALRELETWPAELERRLAEAITELGVANDARQEAQQEVKDLAAALIDTKAKVEGLRGGLEAAQASAHDANVEVIRLTAEAQARSQAEMELREAT